MENISMARPLIIKWEDSVLQKWEECSRKTKRSYRLENFDFYPGSYFINLSNDPLTNATDDFVLKINPSYNYSKRYYTSGTVKWEGTYNYANGKYKLAFEIITTKAGFFAFYHNSALHSINGGDQNFTDKCSNEDIQGVSVRLNEGDDNNIEFLQKCSDSNYKEFILRNPQGHFYDKEHLNKISCQISLHKTLHAQHLKAHK